MSARLVDDRVRSLSAGDHRRTARTSRDPETPSLGPFPPWTSLRVAISTATTRPDADLRLDLPGCTRARRSRGVGPPLCRVAHRTPLGRRSSAGRLRPTAHAGRPSALAISFEFARPRCAPRTICVRLMGCRLADRRSEGSARRPDECADSGRGNLIRSGLPAIAQPLLARPSLAAHHERARGDQCDLHGLHRDDLCARSSILE